MNKIKTLSTILVLTLSLISFTSCSKDKVITANNATKVEVTFDAVDYTYLELKEEADIIAHVKILDELTNKNSFFKFTEEGAIYDFYSEQNAEVIKLYKNNTEESFEKGILIKDSIAISDGADLYASQYNKPLEKGSEYILFLKKATSGIGYCVMCEFVGKINLTDFSQNNNYITEIKFLLDYEAKEPNELIEKILPLEPIAEMVDFTEYEYTTIPTNYGNIEVVQAKLQGDKLHFELHFGEHSITLANFKVI